MKAGLNDLVARVSILFHTIGNAIRRRSAEPIMGRPRVKWPKQAKVRLVATPCPNCGSDVPKPHHLSLDFATLPGVRRKTSVLRCPDCTALFYATRIPPDYAEEAMLEKGRVPFYLQQGAGLSLITRPLARIRAPAGATYVEVGCGFGFGLDYARHAKNWAAQGIDPAGLSALGQQMLGVSIDRRYLGDTEPALASTCDIVMSSETLEHVPSPAAFVAVLRNLLRPAGILILSTPDGADLRPQTPPGILIPLLSPGLHLVFQTEQSLRALLEGAGFRHIVLEKDGHSLVAFASDAAFELEDDNAVLRAEYRLYLERRAGDFPSDHDLFFAFASRALQEAVNDSAFDQATRVRASLEHACLGRYGSPLDTVGARAAAEGDGSLEDLARRMPLTLGGLLYADAILRLASGEDRAVLGDRFRQAAAAAGLLRKALGDLAMEDGMTEDIGWTASAEALLCDAAAGDKNIAAHLAALPPAPNPSNGAARRLEIVERAFVGLVNAGHYDIAAKLSEANGLNAASWSAPADSTSLSDSRRDALFCLAILDSRHEEPNVIERGRGRFNRIRVLLGAPDTPGAPAGLFTAVLRGEIAALERLGRRDEAVRLHESLPVSETADAA